MVLDWKALKMEGFGFGSKFGHLIQLFESPFESLMTDVKPNAEMLNGHLMG